MLVTVPVQARSLHGALNQSQPGEATSGESTIMDVADKATPRIIKRYLATLSPKERVSPPFSKPRIQCLAVIRVCSYKSQGNPLYETLCMPCKHPWVFIWPLWC